MDEVVKEIRQDVKELLQRSAVHNELLREHERRSLALQSGQERLDERMKPVEQHVGVVSAVLKIAGSAAIIFIGQALVRLLLQR